MVERLNCIADLFPWPKSNKKYIQMNNNRQKGCWHYEVPKWTRTWYDFMYTNEKIKITFNIVGLQRSMQSCCVTHCWRINSERIIIQRMAQQFVRMHFYNSGLWLCVGGCCSDDTKGAYELIEWQNIQISTVKLLYI